MFWLTIKQRNFYAALYHNSVETCSLGLKSVPISISSRLVFNALFSCQMLDSRLAVLSGRRSGDSPAAKK